MHNIAQANIDRFNSLLKIERDQTTREMIILLLAEEKEKLKKIAKPELTYIRLFP